MLVRMLSARGDWCLIGGLAVNCYVEPVYTLDTDIVVISSEVPKIKRTKRKKDELDLMRILEKYPETRAMMPEEIAKQVP